MIEDENNNREELYHTQEECDFAILVFWYLDMEYCVNITNYSHDVQKRAVDFLLEMKTKSNVSNIAQKIAYEIVPLV